MKEGKIRKILHVLYPIPHVNELLQEFESDDVRVRQRDMGNVLLGRFKVRKYNTKELNLNKTARTARRV